MVASTFYVPKQVAERFAVDVEVVLGWIRANELSAVNCSSIRNGKKPRWRISEEAIRKFEESRANRPPERITKPRRETRPDNYVEFIK